MSPLLFRSQLPLYHSLEKSALIFKCCLLSLQTGRKMLNEVRVVDVFWSLKQ